MCEWGPHILQLRSDVLRRMDLLKHMASPNWGANCRFLRQFYISYIRAKIDYGSILYRSASASMLSKLDVLQNSCLRLILGARRTTPVVSLHVEAHVPPLSVRRQYLAARFYIRLMHRPEGDRTVAATCGLGPSILNDGAHLLGVLGVSYCRRRPSLVDLVPPWSPVLGLVSLDYRRDRSIPSSMLFSDHVDCSYPDFKEIYCDGSWFLDNMSTACGVYISSSARAVAWRLHPYHSILSAELIAIIRSLELIQADRCPRWVICSDSLSPDRHLFCSCDSRPTAPVEPEWFGCSGFRLTPGSGAMSGLMLSPSWVMVWTTLPEFSSLALTCLAVSQCSCDSTGS